jgi:hypothetical protein
MPKMTIKKKHPSGLERWNEKFLNHHYLPWHDHFGELLMGFAHSTKSHHKLNIS